MTIPASLSKLKSLFPVFVVGASVAITIKLLTESTPLTSEILQVKAEEDIFSPDYKDELVEPKEPEPEPQEPPKEEQSPSAEEQKDTAEESPPKPENKQDQSGEHQEKKEESDAQEKKDEKKPSGGRMFGSSSIAKMLKNIFGGGKK